MNEIRVIKHIDICIRTRKNEKLVVDRYWFIRWKCFVGFIKNMVSKLEYLTRDMHINSFIWT